MLQPRRRVNSLANNMSTTRERADEEPIFPRSHLKWIEDWELRQQELDRLAVEMFLAGKLEQDSCA
jgi:hypothetical protein